MKKLFLTLSVAISMLLTSACSPYRYETVDGDPLETRIYTLDNGLKVYMSVNDEEPRIQTYIAVRVGGKNDPSETTGLAHYFEHLMFKGTEQFGTSNYAAEKPLLDEVEALFEEYRVETDEAKRAAIYRRIDSVSYEASRYSIPNEYDKLMSAIGATGTNAYTGMDQTVYVENIPSNQIENWARIEADRFKRPVLRGFHTELETIYEEKNMSLTQDFRKTYYGIQELLFPNHPYGQQTVLGSQEHLKNPSITNVKNYHATYYVPNNMAICLSGDFDPDEMIEVIDRYFGDMEPNKNLPKLEYAAEAPITEPLVKEVFGPEAESLMIAWPTGGAATEDADYLMLASLILTNGQAGLIDLDLVQQQRVLTAYANGSSQADYGMMTMQGRPLAGQTLEEVRDLLLGEVAKLREGDFSDELLTATVNNLKVMIMEQMEENDARADMYVSAFINGVDWASEVNFLDRIAAITKEQLVAWAAEKLGPENYAIVYKRQGIDPNEQKIAKPALTPILTNRDAKSDFLAEIQASEVAPIEPQFVDFAREMEVFTTASGLEVLYKQNTTNDLFKLSYIFETGTLDDKALAYAYPYLELLGTSEHTAAELAAELYNIACSYRQSVSAALSQITFSGLGENMGRVMDLYEELVADAQPDEEVLAQLKERYHKSRADAKLNQRANQRALQTYAIFGGDAVRRITMNNEELAAMTSEELLAKTPELLGKEHLVIYYGPMSRAELEATLAEHHPVAKELEPVEPKRLEYLPTEKNRVFLANYDAKQIQYLQFANLGGTFNLALEPLLNLYNGYTSGGMNSIVFQEMRESRSLAYSAYTYCQTPSDLKEPYLFQAFIATQNDKMAQAVDAFDEIINEMPESQAAFDLAKESMIAEMRTARTTKDAVLWLYYGLRDLGLTEDPAQATFERLQTLTLEDIKAFQQEWIKGSTYTYCILGDLDDLDQAYIRSLGEVTTLSQEEIFGY